jgi:hypothetical protein
MQNIIDDFTRPSFGQPIWHVRHEIGSMIKFEVGNKIEKDRGEYHYWINCCHWWLHRGEQADYEDIVCSESSKKNIAEKLTILEGKKLLNILFKPEDASTFIDFEDGLHLSLSPYGKNEYDDEPNKVEQWFTFHDDQILQVITDGTVSVITESKE